MMAKKLNTELLLNDFDRNHMADIKAMFKDTRDFECLVAFAKHSIWEEINAALQSALKRGMKARFAIGLSFYHTDPELLRKLFRLSNTYSVQLFISNDNCTFHPKIYAYRQSGVCKIVIGSANLTQGGLANNHEASVLIDDPQGSMMSSVTKYFDHLIDENAIIPASKALIDKYAKEHEINTAWMKLGRQQSKRDMVNGDISLDFLAAKLKLMKEGGKNSDFEKQLKIRREKLAQVQNQLSIISQLDGKSESEFLENFDQLIELFHSGGLNRGKTIIAGRRKMFIKAIGAIINGANFSPSKNFSTLHTHFLKIERAGINLLTEILHSLDNKRFVVMNKNSISGMRMAGYNKFPVTPSKLNVSAIKYQHYCDNAKTLCGQLGLRDFTELDALFNYVYWQEE